MPASTTKRIMALDLLRGYLLFFIIVDHLGRFPGLFDLFTGRGWLWVSASEGFFFISGLMVGYVRGHQIDRIGLKAVIKKVWRRAAELYFWSISLTLLATTIVVLLGRPPGMKAGLPTYINPFGLIVDTLRLHYVYGWADFLPHYVVFMAVAPLALYALFKGKAWLIAVVSLLLWVGRGHNFNLAWQLLFFHGLIFGYYLPRIESWASGLSAAVRHRAYQAVVGLTIATIVVNVSLMYVLPYLQAHFSIISGIRLKHLYEVARALDRWIGPYFNKSTLEPGRLLTFSLWFTAFYLVFRRHEAWIKHRLGKFLLPLGQNSLFVYGVHAILQILINIVLPKQVNIISNVSINVVTLAVIWLIATRYKVWFGFISQSPKSIFSARLQSKKVSS